MKAKMLNYIIIFSIIGLIVISIKDMISPKPKDTFKPPSAVYPTQQLVTPTHKPVAYQQRLCKDTFIGEIPYKQLRYTSETLNNIKVDQNASAEAKTTRERLTLQLQEKTDSSYTFSVLGGTIHQKLTITSTSQGVIASFFGNSFLLVPTGKVQTGGTWKYASQLDLPLGIGEATTVDLKYSVKNLENRTRFGSQRQSAVVSIAFEGLQGGEYTVTSGIGLEDVAMDIDLEMFGAYHRKLHLESVQ